MIDHDQLRELRRLGVQSASFAGGEIVAVSFYAMSDEERGLAEQSKALEQREAWLSELDNDAAQEIAAKAQEELLYGSST